jgi:hypothetical protein
VFPHKITKLAHPIHKNSITTYKLLCFSSSNTKPYMGFGLLHQFIPGFSILAEMDPISQV